MRNERAVGPGEIIDAALRATARQGLEAASLRRVAEEAGTSKSSILHQFGSAAALRRRMVTRIGQLYQEILVRAVAETPGADILNKGPGLLDAVFAEKHREFHLSVQELATAAARDPVMAAEAKTIFERMVWMVTVLLGPPLDTAQPTAQSIIATAQGYLNLWMWSGDPDPKPYRDAAEAAISAILARGHPAAGAA